MDFSEEWKSVFPIGSVFGAPLLVSSPSSKAILGPLFFNPKPQTLTQLFNSPSICPPLLNAPSGLSLSRFLSTSTTLESPIPLSTASSIASLFGPQLHDNAASLLAHNRLQFLRCPHDNAVIIFFSTGCNHDQVGFLLLSVKERSLQVVGDPKGGVLTAKKCLNQRIVKILVNPVADSVYFEGNDSCSSNIVGYLLVYTMSSVHWFSVKISEISERPVLGYVGCKIFKSCSIVDACWSPHLLEESMVLLENGSLFLFDLKSDSSDIYFRGTMLKVSWDDSGNSENRKWLGCHFSWHPRVLIVAGSDAVFLVDWRHDGFKVTCLANIDMFGVYAPIEKERFLVFSKAVSDNFHFVLASDHILALCDVRKPLMPILQWAHGLDKPCYVDVFRLSQLRSNSRKSTHEWATASGFGIILGSFWNYLLLSGNKCRCGSCLVREEFLKDALPEWIDWQQKKDIVLGFGILSNDLSSLLFESDEFGGFTLIRLMSSGKLESQRYYASWDLVRKLEAAHRDQLLCFGDNLLYSLEDEEYKFPRRFNQFRTSPAISVVFNDINLPTSVHEVALRSIWASLPMELLQLAFSSYSEFLEVLLDKKVVSLEFLVVPDLPQLPPFFLRKPSSRSSRWSHKVPHSNALVGPVLPLPILITLHELQNSCPNSQDEEIVHCSTEVYRESNCVHKDGRFAYLISKVHEKESIHNNEVENVRQELFDDLCPIQLKFDAVAMDFSSQELKAYNLLKRHFSKWQEEFKPFQGFYSRFQKQDK
ncbi:hypothetical protein GH714_036333 [Hevea brasiliensis]|uniref:Uncharacterized protein n=1 Tax=Hevea brasiliensis TaxID=3981 RepID=A0A6A6KMZ0_HEVBR|nr:hypothetical protein GH714_036333 [Hevea brasiliensis]